ncbi:MAG: hypothetical protein PHG27_01060 [Massilibacteroides sp.]|nr:hypothetical protein [Massilibacteroides sp.]MDD3063048.1 hypothetical protein [Massilibacteroides sp.]MDD4114175.1 hypothetical protein [Massilibacteroides sp.]MDD4660557.1 hypothetical protein [Massilibacteroides sp.]
MKKVLFILCSFLLAFAVEAQTKTSVITNVWEYSAPNAPYGYQNGFFKIMEEQGKLKGEIIIQQTTVSIPNIKKENDKYTCSFFMEGQTIDVNFIFKDKNLLEGQALGGGMDIPFTCKPAKK